MTTVAYNYQDKQIAVDSRTTAGGFIYSDKSIKFKTINDATWFIAGKKGEMDIFINNFKPLNDAPDNLDITALRVEDGNVYLCTTGGGVFRECLLDVNESIGSGCELAIAAMDFGKSAKEAVKYAMTRDVYTGGKVHVYDIEKGKFI